MLRIRLMKYLKKTMKNTNKQTKETLYKELYKCCSKMENILKELDRGYLVFIPLNEEEYATGAIVNHDLLEMIMTEAEKNESVLLLFANVLLMAISKKDVEFGKELISLAQKVLVEKHNEELLQEFFNKKNEELN